MPRVTFHRQARHFDVKTGGSLLRAARRARVPLATSCRGEGVCKACRVIVLQGAEHLSPLTRVERGADLDSDERLACLACAFGPVTITTTYW